MGLRYVQEDVSASAYSISEIEPFQKPLLGQQ